MRYQVPPDQPSNPAVRPYGARPIPDGDSALPPVRGVAGPPGSLCYPALPPMGNPLISQRPPGAPVLPAASRALVPNATNVRSITASPVRPIISSVTPAGFWTYQELESCTRS